MWFQSLGVYVIVSSGHWTLNQCRGKSLALWILSPVQYNGPARAPWKYQSQYWLRKEKHRSTPLLVAVPAGSGVSLKESHWYSNQAHCYYNLRHELIVAQHCFVTTKEQWVTEQLVTGSKHLAERNSYLNLFSTLHSGNTYDILNTWRQRINSVFISYLMASVESH